MKWAKRLTAIVCVLTMLAFVGYTSVKAEPIEHNNSLEGYELQGLGRMQADIDVSGEFGDNPEDFIYDADDLVTLDNLVKTGKTELSSVINSYQTGDVLTLDTFANFSSAIDSLTTFPSGKYYYDSTTGTDDATTLVRYIKEGEAYYFCDQYGNKTSDEEQAVTESNLVEYRGLTQENLSAGYAGMVDKTFILGNGSDNVTYRNSASNTIINSFQGQQLVLNIDNKCNFVTSGNGTSNGSYLTVIEKIDTSLFTSITINCCAYLGWNNSTDYTREGNSTYTLYSQSGEELASINFGAWCGSYYQSQTKSIDVSNINEIVTLKVKHYYHSDVNDCSGSFYCISVYGTIG